MTRLFPPFVFCSWGLALVLSILFLPSCGGSTDPDDPPISGIVRTEANGAIIEEDVLDWQPRMVESSGGGGGVGVVHTGDSDFAFAPAYPNPATESTALSFTLPENAVVHVWVVDKDGDKVQDLIAGDALSAGQHTIEWQVKDGSGDVLVPPGLYRVYFLIKHGKDLTEVRSFGDVGVE